MYYISLAVVLVAMFGALAVESYQINQCRIEAAKAGKSVDDIQRICKR